MNILIFLIILALLVLVHEFGHFIVAKKSGVRVDEFGLGFPPRIFGKKFGETVYSLNIVPFGGFVKIFGENPEDEETHPDDLARSLGRKNRGVQAAVLAAGVTGNILLAWLIISLGLMSGLPTAVGEGDTRNVSDVRTVISSVVPLSPAERAGLKAGDIILGARDRKGRETETAGPDRIRTFISEGDGEIVVSYKRGEGVSEARVMPEKGIVADTRAIGIRMDAVGTLRLAPHEALVEGSIMTAKLFKAVAVSIFEFIRDAMGGRADLTQVAGPVGMVALVGDARELGFSYVIFFTALLSLNLAVINLIPFPALDGGRLLILLIEAVRRKALNPRFVNTLNVIGFALLILLMVLVTGSDILKLF